MKASRYLNITAAAAAILLLTGGCDSMLDTSLNMSPAPGVNIGVGVSTPISGYWGNGYNPWWDGGYGSPWWGGGLGWHGGWNIPVSRPPMRPGIPPSQNIGRPVRPMQPVAPVPSVPVKPSIPSTGLRPYPTGVGPVTGGTGIRGAATINPGTGMRPTGR